MSPGKSLPWDLLVRVGGGRCCYGSLSFLLLPRWPRVIAGTCVCQAGCLSFILPSSHLSSPPGTTPGCCAVSPGDTGLVIAEAKPLVTSPAHPALPLVCGAFLCIFLIQPCCQLHGPGLKRNNKTLEKGFAVPAPARCPGREGFSLKPV